MEKEINILWTDDEIDLLKSYVLFLEEKGYRISTAQNGEDALELVRNKDFDLILLDENMPGLSGLETLDRIKDLAPTVPVVMITKSEEEDIMDEAIGSKIADYLIKPVNPKQILLSIKKNMDTQRLVTRKTTSAYQMQFGEIGGLINSAISFDDWTAIYRKLVYWERELEESGESGMDDVLQMQWTEANQGFFRYVKKKYPDWFREGSAGKPLLSPNLFREKVFPLLEKDPVVVIIVDNLRYDQWKLIEKEISTFYRVDREEIFSSILPTATQYARNAMFSGLMPSEIEKLHARYWVTEEEEGGKNNYEAELCEAQLKRLGISCSFNYEKITNHRYGKKLADRFRDLLNYDLNVLVYNFVDMLSHARTEMEMIRELAYDDRSYRSLTRSWFGNSYLLELLRLLSSHAIKLVITTDHGAIRVQNPVRVVGDRRTTTNIRYKQGKNLSYPASRVFEVTDPASIYLPRSNVSSTYIFAGNNDYMVYPNNYSYFVNHYRNTFQHGGVSMEEMLIPCVTLSPNV